MNHTLEKSKLSGATDKEGIASLVAHKPPVLTRRFQIEVCFPKPGEANARHTIASFEDPLDALRRCSECLESVKGLLGTPFGQNLEDEAYVSIRIFDAEAGTYVLWEEDDGSLYGEPSVFEAKSRVAAPNQCANPDVLELESPAKASSPLEQPPHTHIKTRG